MPKYFAYHNVGYKVAECDTKQGQKTLNEVLEKEVIKDDPIL